MKKQLVLLLSVVGTFIAVSASAQPYFSARIGIRLPQPRLVIAPPPPLVVVYGQPGYQAPVCDQPLYDQPGYNEPVYAQPGCEAPVVYDNRVVYENHRPVYYRENGYARPRYVEVNRYRGSYGDRGYRNDRNYDHRDGGYHNDGHRRW